MNEEFEYMGRTTKILRENTDVFHNYEFMPLIPALTDSIYINRFTNGKKTVYTIYSLIPGGFSGPLFTTGNIRRKGSIVLISGITWKLFPYPKTIWHRSL